MNQDDNEENTPKSMCTFSKKKSAVTTNLKGPVDTAVLEFKESQYPIQSSINQASEEQHVTQ